MNSFTRPAPMWRRFGAAAYDALIFLAIWAITAQVETPIRLVLGLPPEHPLLQALLFLVGLVFFGWFWTHGGQTVGMRAWRLSVRRLDGAAVRWPIAAARYSVMMVWAGVLLAPFVMLLLPNKVHIANRPIIAFTAAPLAIVGLLLQGFDSRRRAPHDWVAGTEVIFVPRERG
jgi:uncharacterized RDD family membrane protein YckC